MNTNSYYIQLAGKANIPDELILGHGYKIVAEGEITKVSENNNHDGTSDKTFKFEPALCEIHDDAGLVVKAKDRRSRSAQIRRILYKMWEENPNDVLDHEEAYERTMKWIIANIGDIYEQAMA